MRRRTEIARAIAASCGVLAPLAAQAHAFLHAASPAVGATLAAAPTEVSIDFTEGVEPMFSTIEVTDAAGRRVDTGAAHLEGGDRRLAVKLGRLAPGTYRVTWHATATDTHRTEGSFTFTVKD